MLTMTDVVHDNAYAVAMLTDAIQHHMEQRYQWSEHGSDSGETDRAIQVHQLAELRAKSALLVLLGHDVEQWRERVRLASRAATRKVYGD